MSSSASLAVAYKVANSRLLEFPYPHIYVEDVFPQDYFQDMRRLLPSVDDYESLSESGRVPKGTYKERFSLFLTPDKLEKLPAEKRAFWAQHAAWMGSGEFLSRFVGKFKAAIDARMARATGQFKMHADMLLVKDFTNYALGPHSDSVRKVISVIFYLPADESAVEAGTSIYVPKDKNFVCRGGPHYPFDGFEKMATMPYKPNSMFAFVKNPVSFHGVEKVERPDFHRDLLIYDIQMDRDPGV